MSVALTEVKGLTVIIIIGSLVSRISSLIYQYSDYTPRSFKNSKTWHCFNIQCVQLRRRELSVSEKWYMIVVKKSLLYNASGKALSDSLKETC